MYSSSFRGSGDGKASFRYYYGSCADQDSEEEDERNYTPIFGDEEIPVNLDHLSESESDFRSPVVRILRQMVEEDVPKLNFGDYDPVKSVSSADQMRRPKWSGNDYYQPHRRLQARRVIYKGIASSDVNANLRKKQWDQRRQSTDVHGEFEWSDVNKEEGSQFEEIWIRNDPATAEPADPYKNKRTYSNVTRGRETSGSETYKRTFSEAEATSQANVRGRRSQSSWMEYSRGTGFFHSSYEGNDKMSCRDDQWSESEVEPYVRRSEFATPVEYGYRTSSHDQASQSSKQSSGFGQNEKLFCQKLSEIKYFHRLRRLPIPDQYGIFFGFELEFWPCDDPDMKETVWGNQLTNLFAAKDSAFAAGLMKLEQAQSDPQMSGQEQFNEHHDEGAEDMQQIGRIQASVCQRPIRDNTIHDKDIPYEVREGGEVLVEYYRRGNARYTSESDFQFGNTSKSYNSDKPNFAESDKNQNYFKQHNQYAESTKPDESDEEYVKYDQRYGANDLELRQSDRNRKHVSTNAERYPRSHGTVPEIRNRFLYDKAPEDYGGVIRVYCSSDDEEDSEVPDREDLKVVTSVSSEQQPHHPIDSFKIAIPRDSPRSITHPKRNRGKFKLWNPRFGLGFNPL